ncbi:MAG: DUF4013 domain-containing protein [Coriobacteriales bacterium]|jgi:hypothetical protein|nr:DUF4013 domain-containing protein [Coriobacteriales bacterium]
MKIKYFSTVYSDLQGSPHWLRKMFFLALLLFIPIFGGMMVQSYLYGWARDAAFGVQTPLARRVFGNEDGQLYARGGRLFIVQLLYGLLPFVLVTVAAILMLPWQLIFEIFQSLGSGTPLKISSEMSSFAFAQDFFGHVMLYTALCALAALLALVLEFFSWAGSLRVSIYGSVKAGLQLGAIIAMFKRDFTGILKIFGMSLLVGLVVSLIIGFVTSALSVPFVILATGVVAGMVEAGMTDPAALLTMIAVVLGIYLLLTVISCYLAYAGAMLAETLVVRALGYWARTSLPDLGWPTEAPTPAPANWPAANPPAPGTPTN